MIVLRLLWFVHVGNWREVEINSTHYHIKRERWKSSCSVSTMLKTYNKNPMLLLQKKKITCLLQFFDHGLLDVMSFFHDRNIVSTVNLDCKLELKAIALQARNAEYNPKVYWLPQTMALHGISWWFYLADDFMDIQCMLILCNIVQSCPWVQIALC